MAKAALLTAAALVCLSVFASCTTNPYTGQKQTSKTAWGTAIGAGVGAIAGGGVGLYMDKQEAKLRQQLQNTGVSVSRQGDRIELVMPSNITFDTNSSSIKPTFYDVLHSVGLVLKEYNKTLINITGHTDNTGSDQYNQDLSRRRAQSVAQYLTSQGIDPTRVAAQGMGESRPIASNETPQGRQQNRRVQVDLAPLTAEG
jgi:outer membrane protein OmpA-like peptidoglycan-associated protein